MHTRVCPHCNTDFVILRSDGGFCSKSCRNKFDHWRRTRHPGLERTQALLDVYAQHMTLKRDKARTA